MNEKLALFQVRSRKFENTSRKLDLLAEMIFKFLVLRQHICTTVTPINGSNDEISYN